MPKYGAELNKASASTTLAVGAVLCGSTTRRGKVFELVFGSEATPADNAFLWQVDRQTTVGTATAVTPSLFDSADPAALAAARENYTTNGTLSGTIILSVALNQRATFRWSAAPGRELVWPNTANNGFAVLTPTSSAVAVTATVLFEE